MAAKQIANAAKSKGGRPTQARAGEIEQQILAVASTLFLQQGYGAVSIETVAKTAGISKRTFYHRFDDKAELFAGVLRYLTQTMRRSAEPHLFEGKNLRSILQQLAEAILKAAMTPEALGLSRLLFAEASRFPELAEVIKASAVRQEAIDAITQLLQREAQEGRISLPHIPFAAEQFLHMVLTVPQRRALGLGSPMNNSELAIWSQDCTSLFLYGCNYADQKDTLSRSL